jgi:hypothetical protein
MKPLRPGRPGFDRVAAALLLLALLLQAVWSMRLLSATFDETAHLPSGYSYLTNGEIRLNPQHPPLIKLLAGAPLLVLGPRLDPQDPGWLLEPPDEWGIGYRFLYGNDADRLLFWGRLPVVLLALLMAVYVYRWARDLFGPSAGLAALFLCAFSPTVIAHSRLVTMDVGLAAFSTVGLYHLWRFTRDGGARQLILAGLGLGLALASKFSGVVLIGVFVLLVPVAAARRDADGRRPPAQRAGWAALALIGLLALAALVVHASYLFPADPLVYVNGMLQVNRDHDPTYPYYLMGEFRPGGWWYYFLVAFAVKTPVPTLVLLLLAVATLRRHPAPHGLDELFLVVPVVAYVAATSLLADNLGVRYLLPVYPLLFIFVSRLVHALPGRRAARVIAVVLAVWYAAGTLRIFPDHLAYFNELVGGPAAGHRWLDDSNIDWGQDLKRLKRYMDERGIEEVRLRYGRNDSPGYYGIRSLPVSDREWAGEPRPGVYAIGTHLLIRGEYYARESGAATDWLSRHEPIGRVGYSIYLFEFE